MKKILFILLMLCVTSAVFASLSVGAFGGADCNVPERNTGWAEDVKWNKEWGYTVGANVGYSFNSWFALRSGVAVMAKNYRLTRTAAQTKYLYTDYRDLYLELPLLADFSIGRKALRCHALGGVYFGLWASEKRKGTTFGMYTDPEKNVPIFIITVA